MIQKLIQQGLEAHRSGDIQRAQSYYKQALVSDPGQPDALHLSGVAYLQQGDADRAIELIRKALEVQPGNPAFNGNLAQAYAALKRHDDALEAFLRAQALDPRNPQFAVGAANCLAMQGRSADAEQQLRAVTRTHPEFGFAGLKPGDQWCLCAARFLEAYQAGKAPRVRLMATHKRALDIVPLDCLREYALERN